jgi:hypothetical protein
MDVGAENPEKPPQGWFVDPYGIHDHRYYSQGKATALVRDGRAEAQDPPPEGVVTGPLVPARAAPTGRESEDLLRGADRGRTPSDDPEDRFDVFGEPALPGTVGMSPAVPLGGPLGGRVIDPMDVVAKGPPAPKRTLRTRWIALIGAVVWSFLICCLFAGITTTVATGVPGHVRDETVLVADPGAVAFLVVLLAVGCTVSGVSFVRRARQGSEAWSRGGCVCVGCIALLGFLSLASIGLSLVMLAAMLFVVARPLRKLRPIPGDRLVGT